MPHWQDPSVIDQNAKAFASILLVVLGLYAWEFLTTLWFEASFLIQPRRKWRIEHVSYFACRYSFLAVTIILTALYTLTEEVNCPAFGQSAQVLGNIAIGTATLNILYRAWAISLRYGRLLTIALAIAEVGHWVILIWNVFTVHSEWSAAVDKCNITLTSRPALVALYVYTMLFDFTILVICITGLWKHKPKTGATRGQIWQLIRRQGIYYFLISFTANLLPFIFILLDLNPVMNTITTVPAACATTIASCRAVIWLTTWVETDCPGVPGHHPEIPMTPPAPDRRRTSTKPKPSKKRDLECGGLTTADVGLPSEIFARTRRNDDEVDEQVMRSTSSDFKSPASLSPHSPPHYSPTSGTHPVILSLSDKDENQADYYPYDDRGRGKSADSRPSTGDDGDRPVRNRYHVS